MNTWAHLARLQPPLITPLQGGTQCLAVVNPRAGRFKATEVASQVAEQVGSRMSVYETVEDDRQRLRDIVERIASKHPSLENPLTILAFGGDRTGNDAIEGAIDYLFPKRRELLTLSSEEIADRMFFSGIQIGYVRLGGANDIGANYGAPGKKVEEIMAYMDNCRLTWLNLGLSLLDEYPQPYLFGHSLCAGETIATPYERTAAGRGMGAMVQRGGLGLWNIVFTHRTFDAQWQHSDGSSGEERILEVVVHPAVRLATSMGLPHAPLVGMGSKIFVGGYGRKLRILGEATSCGFSARKGDPSRLTPEERLKTLDTRFQPTMEVGQSMEFKFFSQGKPYETAVTINGDFARRAHRVQVFALPPWPRTMVSVPSLMANLHDGKT